MAQPPCTALAVPLVSFSEAKRTVSASLTPWISEVWRLEDGRCRLGEPHQPVLRDGKLLRTAIAVSLVSFSEAKRKVSASLTPWMSEVWRLWDDRCRLREPHQPVLRDGKLLRTAIAVSLVSFSEAKRTVSASLTPELLP